MTTPFPLKTSAPNKARLSPFELFAPHCLDSYKLGHKDQYVPGTEYIYDNFTPRADKHLNLPREFNDHKYVVGGVLGAWKEIVALWDRTFFSKPKEECLAKYRARVPAFTGKEASVQHLADLHDLGYLPLRVKMIPEGSRVNIGVPFMTIVNTLPQFYWLPNGLETHISNEVWKPLTAATIAHCYRRMLDHFAELTGSPKDFVPWQGHDFADRGMSGMMDAAKTGGGHSLSFWGTDSVSAFDWLDFMYQGSKTFMGGSVPATEHSVMTIGGKEGEKEIIKRVISEVHPDGVVSFVADGYDFWKVLTEYAVELKDVILARKPNELGLSKVVFRPDSGDPVKILTGYTWQEVKKVGVLEPGDMVPVTEVIKFAGKYYFYAIQAGSHEPTVIHLHEEIRECEVKGAVEVLWDIFGGTHTDRSYRVVSQRVGLIYGDSITPQRCLDILQRLANKSFASCNVVLGIGSYTYQFITRDTLGMAIKATWAQVNGEGVEIFKDPATDKDKMKKSAKGLVKVLKSQEHDGEKYNLVSGVDWEEEDTGELKLVFENGNFLVEPSLEEARNRLFATA
jgi:nicotinamide phosphoribosyltransferase